MINPFFIHPLAVIDPGATVGEGTRVWAFAHLTSGAVIGRDCNVCDHTFIENNVKIGDRVTIKCGVHLWDGVLVEDDVFIGPNAAFSNDRTPRSKRYPATFLRTVLCQGASIGANATLLPGLTIGEWAMVGAGAVITRNVPAYGLVLGNPARFVTWVCRCGQKLQKDKEMTFRCACGRRFRESIANELLEPVL